MTKPDTESWDRGRRKIKEKRKRKRGEERREEEREGGARSKNCPKYELCPCLESTDEIPLLTPRHSVLRWAVKRRLAVIGVVRLYTDTCSFETCVCVMRIQWRISVEFCDLCGVKGLEPTLPSITTISKDCLLSKTAEILPREK